MIKRYFLRDKARKTSDGFIFKIIKAPYLTEKTSIMVEANKLVLEVDINANKIDIKRAVEAIFELPVESVNTLISKPRTRVFRGKKGTKSAFKKAIITVKKGHDISKILGAQA